MIMNVVLVKESRELALLSLEMHINSVQMKRFGTTVGNQDISIPSTSMSRYYVRCLKTAAALIVKIRPSQPQICHAVCAGKKNPKSSKPKDQLITSIVDALTLSFYIKQG